MKNCFAFLLAAALLPGILTGCKTTTREQLTFAPVATAPDIDKTGREYGEAMLKGLQKCDYKTFCAPLGERAEKTTEQSFREKCGNMQKVRGEIASYEFLTDMDQTLFKDFLWKVRFERDVKRDDGSIERIVRYSLFKLTLCVVDGKVAVTSCEFR